MKLTLRLKDKTTRYVNALVATGASDIPQVLAFARDDFDSLAPDLKVGESVEVRVERAKEWLGMTASTLDSLLDEAGIPRQEYAAQGGGICNITRSGRVLKALEWLQEARESGYEPVVCTCPDSPPLNPSCPRHFPPQTTELEGASSEAGRLQWFCSECDNVQAEEDPCEICGSTTYEMPEGES